MAPLNIVTDRLAERVAAAIAPIVTSSTRGQLDKLTVHVQISFSIDDAGDQ